MDLKIFIAKEHNYRLYLLFCFQKKFKDFVENKISQFADFKT